ncbi:MAG TPA: hypothetical protein VFF78_04140, partial [Anaerolineaceae bacterium]|nr:hypothetical protein [Anaerolineaceae bacterium]
GYNLLKEQIVEQPSSTPPFGRILMISLIVAAIGLMGLIVVITLTLPYLGPRWLFFFFLTLLLTGVFLPVVAFLNRRFPSAPPANGGVLVRQALWFGVYADLLAWLQMGRVLTLSIAFYIGAGLLLIEIFLRMYERSKWKPPAE